VSTLGDHVTGLALPLFAVLALHAGPAQMGYLIAALLAPTLLFSLLAGAWIDRYPRKRQMMIVADLGRALLLAAVPLAYLLNLLTLEQLYLAAFLHGTLSVLFEVCDGTVFVSLVSTQDYLRANTLLNGSRAMCGVAGPSLGGILVQTLTAPIALLADVVSFLASALFLMKIQPTEPAPSHTKALGIGHGLRFIARSAVYRSTLLALTTLNLFRYTFTALFVLYVVTELGVTPGVLGAVIGAGAIGGVLGAAVTGPIARRIGIGPALVLSFVILPAPVLLVPLAGGPTPLILGMLIAAEFCSGIGMMILDITVGSVLTAVTPDLLRARTAGALLTINYGIRPIGALLGGALGVTLGVRPTLWIATIGALTGVLWLLPSPVAKLQDLPAQAQPQ
jgi:MFS family permease